MIPQSVNWGWYSNIVAVLEFLFTRGWFTRFVKRFIQYSNDLRKKTEFIYIVGAAVYISKGNRHRKISHVFLVFGLDLEETCSFLKLLHAGFIQKKLMPNRMKRTNAMYKHVVIADNRNSRLYTPYLLTAVKISKGNHQTIGKLDILCVFLGLGWISRKCSILKLLHFGYIYI